MLLRPCDRLVRSLKGVERRTRREAEGYADVDTIGVPAAEGLPPGGLETGMIPVVRRSRSGRRGPGLRPPPPDRRPAARLRAGRPDLRNGKRFVTRRFHREADTRRAGMPAFAPVVLTVDDDAQVRVTAEVLEVLGTEMA